MLDPTWRAAPRPAAPARVLVVLPTYDEIENVDEVLGRLRVALPDATVLVVDDASPDGTGDRVALLARRDRAIRLLRRPRKLGLGSAYRDGFRQGLADGFDVLVEMDADLSHDPAVLPALVDAVVGGADLVIGSRYVPGGAVPGWPLRRRLVSRTGCRYAQIVLGLPVADATSGLRAYRADALRAVGLDRVRADGYGFQVEMAYRVHTLGGTIAEIPIEFRDRVSGRSKMSARIVLEALLLVTRWGLRDRVNGSRRLSRVEAPVR